MNNATAKTALSTFRVNMAATIELMGRAAVGLTLLSVPVGAILAVLEIYLGIALLGVINYFGFMSPSDDAPNIIKFNVIQDPIWNLILCALLLTAFRAVRFALPWQTVELLNERVRDRVSQSILGGKKESNSIALAELTNVLSVQLPRGGRVLDHISVIGICAIQVLALLTSMAYLDVKATAILLVSSMAMALPLPLLRKALKRCNVESRNGLEKFTSGMVRAARNVYFIRLSGMQAQERERLATLSNYVMTQFNRFTILYSITAAIPQFFGILLIVWLLYLVRHYGFVGSSAAVPFAYMLWRLASTSAQLANSVVLLQGQWVFFDGLVRNLHGVTKPVEDATETVNQPVAALEGLEVCGLAVGRSHALVEDVSFSLRAGEMLVVSGASGRGKTTLLMTLVGVVAPLKGTVLWSGVPVNRLSSADFRSHVGYAGQDPFLFEASIRTNLLYGNPHKDVSEAEILQVLQLAQCNFVAEHPDGLNRLLKDEGEGISAGQRQRLAIARCLLRRPDIILFDEATANIDEETESRIIAAIRQEYPAVIIVAVSHRASIRHYATQIISL